MRASSIELLVVGLSLLRFVDPLRNDNVQRSYSVSYDSSLPFISHPSVYDSSSIDERLPRVTNEKEKEKKAVGGLDSSSYPEGIKSIFLPIPAIPTEYRDYGLNYDRSTKGDEINLKEEDKGSSSIEGEIIEKMKILDKFLSEDAKDIDVNGIEDNIIPEESKRVVREVKKQKPGFFWTLAKLTFEVKFTRDSFETGIK